MIKLRTNKLPTFFNYREEHTDNGYESIQDFFISWTIRCAVEEFESENEILNNYAKRIIFLLMFGRIEKGTLKISKVLTPDFKILNITTRRQVGLIDLVAEVEYVYKDEQKKCVLNIENKWYSGIRQLQLEKSHKFIRQIYTDEIVDIVLFCDDEKISEDVVQHCCDNQYKYLTVGELKDFSGITLAKKSGNDLFDEYWLNF